MADLDSLTDCTTDYPNGNMFLGDPSGVAISSGQNNTALGYLASSALTTGNNNVATGNGALSSNVSGSENVAIGNNALSSMTQAGGNIAIGASTLGALATGATHVENIAIGRSAMQSFNSGSSNIGMGGGAFYAFTSGVSNVGIGDLTFRYFTGGDHNVSVGAPCTTFVSGDNNIFIGYTADATAATVSNYIAIGDAITGDHLALNIAGDPTTTTQSPNDNSTKIATTAYVDNAVSGVSGLTVFTSSAQTITSAGALTIAHGLGTDPLFITAYIQCTSADAGYSVGQKLVVGLADSGSSATRDIAVTFDSTNIYVRYASTATAFAGINWGTGGTAAFTNTKWNLYLRAYI